MHAYVLCGYIYLDLCFFTNKNILFINSIYEDLGLDYRLENTFFLD